MATINRRGSRWQLNWSEGRRQYRRTLGAIPAHDAEIARRTKELELATGRRIFFASPLFDDFIDDYLAWHRGEFPHSHSRVSQIAEQHFTDFRGKALAQIEATDIEQWKAKRLAVVTASTVEKELRTLSAVFAKAIEWGKLEKHPAINVAAPQNLESEPIRWYTKPELAKLYRRFHGPIWQFMANTGLRRAEAQQLRIEHVDVKRKIVKILSTDRARTKSGKWREVPLSDSALAALRTLIRTNRSSGFVLPRVTGPSLSRAFARNVASLKLGGSLHSLRHSYGAHLVMAGVPLRTLQVLMGHASFATTERYAHVGKDHLRNRARRVNL